MMLQQRLLLSSLRTKASLTPIIRRSRTYITLSHIPHNTRTLLSTTNLPPNQTRTHHRSQHTLPNNNHHHHTTDSLLVIGSGIAGCATALTAASHNIPVTLLYAGNVPTDCNSYWAQGGIIYRNYDPNYKDSAESLVRDVKRAGAGLCDSDAVWKVAKEGPERVRQLLLNEEVANVPFDRDEQGDLLCCLEASHSAPRIIHSTDATGKAITSHITSAASSHPLISTISNTIVTDLILHRNTCVGVRLFDKSTHTSSIRLSSQGIILASGGFCGIYQHSTNPPGFNALGSSVALALRAGAQVKDLEYVQFHPTALYVPGSNEAPFLLTEALRGEGAILRDANGTPFAKEFHPDGELAPRDVVARGVFAWNRKSATHNVFLDITHRDARFLRKRFPSIQRFLVRRGLDLTKDSLPIIPAAHYSCGGVETDLVGKTSVKGLYAVGEAARTGLHGGNRLASTSLLEGLVFGASVGEFIANDSGLNVRQEAREVMEDYRLRGEYNDVGNHHSQVKLENGHAKTAANWLLDKLRQVMWDKVGVVRTPSETESAVHILREMREEACELFDKMPCAETAGLRDASVCGEAVAEAAFRNRVSKGAHYVTGEEIEEEEEMEEVEMQRQAFS